ncbi:NAD(P)-dependent alcohol dehydrogenase [Caballeronia sp. GAWG2-1]|uniref:zinc-dependent alcohol dehydrogenase family protein n=1 Tax=Caballeronia sp. GAWG2-1 TaxID=2921744 RepID=UPI0020293771|nr:NAD(P)-dependent alcohol dehydrogenase [Caballeronia sp. GAWG2-1]
MKAIRVVAPGGLDRLEFVDIADPGMPGASEIRVRIHATSLNYHDLIVADGRKPVGNRRIPMADGAGVVEAVGSQVTEFAVGDYVVSTFFPTWLEGAPTVGDFSTVPGDGVDGFAVEYVVRAASSFTHAPKGFRHVEAATLTTAGVTAWRALVVDAAIKAGDTVLVLGTGGVSIFAMQLAKSFGANVIATSSSDAKLERAREIGADHLINYNDQPDWCKEVITASGGCGVDIVVEVGGPGTLAQSIKSCRIGGHIALIGVLTGGAGPVPTAAMMVRQQTLQGLIVGSREHQRQLVRALDSTGVRPVVDAVFPLENLAEAFRVQDKAAHFGKICVEF